MKESILEKHLTYVLYVVLDTHRKSIWRSIQKVTKIVESNIFKKIYKKSFSKIWSPEASYKYWNWKKIVEQGCFKVIGQTKIVLMLSHYCVVDFVVKDLW